MDLPLDICEKILLNLEVKDIVRFKSVCSSWNELISSPRFVQRQLEHARFDPEQNYHGIFLVYPPATIGYNAFANAEEKDSKRNRISKKLCYPRPLQFIQDLIILGSCDGLIFLSSRSSRSGFIWNPSLKEFLPIYMPSVSYHMGFYWFGRNSVNNGGINTYKLVVGIVQSHRENHYREYCRIGLFSSNGDHGLYNWRMTEETVSMDRHRLFEERGTFLNGIVHWPAYDLLDKSVVISYDLLSSKVGRIRGPPHAVGFNDINQSRFAFALGVYGGCLCAICKAGEVFVEIWMMKEYGVGDSWTKLMKFKSFKPNSRSLQLLGFLKNGDVMVDVDQRRLLRYSFDSETAKVVKVHDNHYLSDAVTYVESLISPKKAFINYYDPRICI